ncbi:MAG: pilus assembly protein chaperone PapD-like protein [Ramlibacter sp.]|nr:pilus assembly protein chaperone PapD-like protein [Ramlibacter sp.]
MDAFRHLNRWVAVALGVLGGMLTPAAPARAQVLIDPVVVEVGPRQRTVAITVTLSAKAAAPVLLQSQALSWEQAADGSPRLQPTQDLVIAPPIAELKPGESQVFRVALRGPRREPGELAYRLVLEDTYRQPAATAGQGVSFRMRYDLPVLVAPAEPVRNDARWEACAADAAQACVRIDNRGNKRVSLHALTIEGAAWTVPVAAPGVVLAGARREWRIPVPGGASPAPLRVSGSLRSGEAFRADLSSR